MRWKWSDLINVSREITPGGYWFSWDRAPSPASITRAEAAPQPSGTSVSCRQVYHGLMDARGVHCVSLQRWQWAYSTGGEMDNVRLSANQSSFTERLAESPQIPRAIQAERSQLGFYLQSRRQACNIYTSRREMAGEDGGQHSSPPSCPATTDRCPTNLPDRTGGLTVLCVEQGFFQTIATFTVTELVKHSLDLS